MIVRLVVALFLAFGLAGRPGSAAAASEVDVELVLAVDISLSMDYDELRLQRQGYVDALRDPEVLRAIRGGLNGRIAVAYFEWAGFGLQHVIVPWTLVHTREDLDTVIQRLEAAPINRHRRTSISGALMTSMDLFSRSPFQGRRRVIDISGDGPNNEGPLVHVAREAVIQAGIVINGLPVMIKRQQAGWFDIDMLDDYYEDCVIGGAGSFMIPVNDKDAFAQAIRTKLIMEISDLGPRQPLVVPAASEAPRVPCDIGERMMQRWEFR